MSVPRFRLFPRSRLLLLVFRYCAKRNAVILSRRTIQVFLSFFLFPLCLFSLVAILLSYLPPSFRRVCIVLWLFTLKTHENLLTDYTLSSRRDRCHFSTMPRFRLLACLHQMQGCRPCMTAVCAAVSADCYHFRHNLLLVNLFVLLLLCFSSMCVMLQHVAHYFYIITRK